MLRLPPPSSSSCCLLCLRDLGRRPPLQFDGLVLRPLLTRGMAGGPRTQPRKKPSRMVLSNRVAQTPEKSKRKQTLLPTGGLNQKEANIPQAVLYQRIQHEAARERHAGRDERGKAKPSKEKPVFKHLKMAQVLEHVSARQKDIAREELENAYSFEDFDLLTSVKEGVKETFKDLKTLAPTPVQRLSIPALLGKHDSSPTASKKLESFLMAAETGSGKTLGYLLPIIDHLKRDEEAERSAAEVAKAAKPAKNDFNIELDPDEISIKCRPRAVILVPTAELVNQVGAAAKQLTHTVKFRCAPISTQITAKVIRARLMNRPDLVIATPTLLASIVHDDPFILSQCRYMVVDEADSLFDRSFSEVTNSIIERAVELTQLTLCSATITRHLDTKLRKIFPDIKRLVTPNLHAIPRRVQLSVVDVDGDPYRGSKQLACADTLYNIAKDPSEVGFIKKVIVFVNQRDTAPELAEYLRSKGIDAVEFERDTKGRGEAAGVLEWFTGPKVEAKVTEEKMSSLKAGDKMVALVTTDIASRGIDTKTVKNVILYDVPFSTIDFIHRLGRTGRMGRRGRAVVLVDKNTNKAWVREVKTAMYMGSSLI